MNKMRLQERDRKYFKVPSRDHRAEEYNNWTEKCIRGIQLQNKWKRKKAQWTWRLCSESHIIRAEKRKNGKEQR